MTIMCLPNLVFLARQKTLWPISMHGLGAVEAPCHEVHLSWRARGCNPKRQISQGWFEGAQGLQLGIGGVGSVLPSLATNIGNPMLLWHAAAVQ